MADGRMIQFLAKAITPRAGTLNSVTGSGGWWPVIREGFAGAWQKNIEVKPELALTFHAVYSCLTLIASDISKLRVKLVAKDADGIWAETKNASYSPVIRKPNGFQNRIQFWENYILSKLTRGNTYVLKKRDSRNVVTGLYVLNPLLVTPLVADNGDVYYDLNTDNLAGLPRSVVVPASEIIHDRYNCFFHPLVGISPLFACGLAATQGLDILKNSTKFFRNGSQPGGVLSAPGHIADDTAARLKASWEEKFSGENQGKVAVLGDGLKYEQMGLSAQESQLIEQLKWSAETVCSVFHVPPFMAGIGAAPAYNNVEALNQQYYSQALQHLIEAAELCLDEGLGIGEFAEIGTEFDLDGLLRMDTATQYKTLGEGIKSSLMAPNEARRKVDLKPLTGGDTVYMQQQNFSLAALHDRDQDKPFSKPVAAPATTDGPPPDEYEQPDPEKSAAETRAWSALFEMKMLEGLNA